MKWKNYNQEDCCYFVTATLRNFTPLFADKEIVSSIFDSLNFLRRNKGLKIYAYVVMPEHVHLVASVGDASVTTLIGDFKRFTSRKIAKWLRVNNPPLFEKLKADAYKGQNYAVWQETFRSEVIYGRKFLAQKIDYIYNNPVRRGLVEEPGDWKYTSFNQAENDEGLGEEGLIVDKMDF
ncbi:MAG: transposase [Deltaproteobacteria bacterium]|nr:transposase [Deltaproteobacteria bacterium]